MSFDEYSSKFTSEAEKKGISKESISIFLKYAKNLDSKNLPIIYSRTHLAKQIKININYFNLLINDEPSNFYRKFNLKKKNHSKFKGDANNFRTINAPLPNLRFIQNWILYNILYKIPCHENATAYIKGKSLKDNLHKHINQKIVLKLDIHKFFDSIEANLVENLFHDIGYSAKLAKDFTTICCLNNSLPQGASTSAYISNLILLPFDRIISNYCDENKIKFTRYADDLTFSGDDSLDYNQIISKVNNELEKVNLKINLDKTKTMFSHQRQYVTGVVVNNKIQLEKSVRNELRMINYIIKKKHLDSYLETKRIDKDEFIEKLKGQVNFGIFLNPSDKQLIELKKNIQQIK